METKQTCRCGATHQGHICILRSKGLTEEVAHLTDKPTVVCFLCGVEANAPENVCEPMPL
ncbi:hypothetical protein GURASL_08980 [Geotalea uraniireducens]|uniref:Uncharacterized protein n=1 Tax=Geotalea uraniireducens TaxID=351604 RepID=A0ABN6VSA7_9BACT|nr:hypothetical protein [Geotalea uraniireducens]BDV41975.1 hypothetical protein GURASL_08980 [Geotalea uraniireducens]